MKTIKNMVESIKDYVDPQSTKIRIVLQEGMSLKKEATICETLVSLDKAEKLFGDYEIIYSSVSTYETENFNFVWIHCVAGALLENK